MHDASTEQDPNTEPLEFSSSRSSLFSAAMPDDVDEGGLLDSLCPDTPPATSEPKLSSGIIKPRPNIS